MAVTYRGGVDIPGFLNYEPEWYRWGARSTVGKVGLVALCLVPLVGQVVAVGLAAADSFEVALAKKLQQKIMNLPEDTPFHKRKTETLQALRTLKTLKGNRINNRSDVSTLNNIILNLSGAKLRPVINDIEVFTRKHGHDVVIPVNGVNVAHRQVDVAGHPANPLAIPPIPAKRGIAAYTYEETREALTEVERLIKELKKLDENEMLLAYDGNDFLNAHNNVDGLLDYETHLKARMKTLGGIIATQKARLRDVIRGANRAYVSSTKQAQLRNDLAAIRTALAAVDPEEKDKEAFKALGMKGYDDNMGLYLDAVGKCINDGYVNGDIRDSELGRLSIQPVSIQDIGIGALSSAAIFGAASSAPHFTAAATILSGGWVGAIALGAIFGAGWNFFRHGALYQVMDN
jgi:hypothetical protein